MWQIYLKIIEWDLFNVNLIGYISRIQPSGYYLFITKIDISGQRDVFLRKYGFSH